METSKPFQSPTNAACFDSNKESPSTEVKNSLPNLRTQYEVNGQRTKRKNFTTTNKPRLRHQLSLPKLQRQGSSGKQRLPDLVRTFQMASAWKKKATNSSPTPRVDSFLERFEMGGQYEQSHCSEGLEVPVDSTHRILDPSKTALYRWQILVTLAVLYNFVFIIARTSFFQLHLEMSAPWFVLDYLCDTIYIADMFVQSRTGETNLTI